MTAVLLRANGISFRIGLDATIGEKQMSDYPQLTEMGIQHPEQITTHAINSISGVDVLRVVYKRKQGSLLPVSRSYEFPRVQSTVTNSKGEDETVMETAPALKAAAAELEALLESRDDDTDLKATLRAELEALEGELACRIKHLRSLLDDA